LYHRTLKLLFVLLNYYSFSVEKRRKKENKKTNKKKSEKVTGRIKKWKAKRIKETCSFM